MTQNICKTETKSNVNNAMKKAMRNMHTQYNTIHLYQHNTASTFFKTEFRIIDEQHDRTYG